MRTDALLSVCPLARRMQSDLRGAGETAAVQLATLTAGVHLYLGVDKLYPYLQAGSTFSARPRTYLFLLSGVAILVGITLWAKTDLRRDVIYALGIVVVGGNVATWLLIGGHGTGFITPAWVTQGHSHGGPVGTLISHFFGSRLLVLTKVTELLTVAVLGVLLVDDLRGGRGEGEDPSAPSQNREDDEREEDLSRA